MLDAAYDVAPAMEPARSRSLLGLADLVPLVLIVLLTLFWHRQLLHDARVIAGDDVVLQDLPQSKIVHEALEAGRLPLWTPDEYFGYPFYAEGQAGVFYPPALLTHKLVLATTPGTTFPGSAPWQRAFALELFAHHLAFALLIYLLARHLSSSPPAALMAALAVGFGGFATGHMVHQNVVRSLPYLPLLWLFSLRASENGDAGTARDVAFHAVVLALLFLAGHHQTAFLIALAWVAWVAHLEQSRGGPWVRRTARRVVLPIGLAMLLAGVQLYPTFELWMQSAPGPAPEFAERAVWSFRPSEWVHWLFPFLYGAERPENAYYGRGMFHELVSYVGLVPLLLIAVARPWREGHWRFIAGFLLTGVLLAQGAFSPLYPLHLVPPLSLFRDPCRFLIWVEFGLGLLAARALDLLVTGAARELEERFLARFSAVRVFLMGALFVVGTFALYFGLSPDTDIRHAIDQVPILRGLHESPARTLVAPDRREQYSHESLETDPRARLRLTLLHASEGGFIALWILLLARGVLGLRASGWVGAETAAAWLTLIAALDVVGLFSMRVWGTYAVRQLMEENGIVEFLHHKAPSDRSFLAPLPGRRDLLDLVRWRAQAANLYSSIATIGGSLGSPAPANWVEFLAPPQPGKRVSPDALLDTLARIDPVRDQWKLSLAGVGWLTAATPVPGKDWLPRMSEEDVTLYRNKRALKRLFLARPIRPAQDGEDLRPVLATLAAKVPAVSIQRPGQPDLLALSVIVPRDSVSLTESRPEELYALANLSAPAWLVVADLAYPGWKAYVNEREVPLATACGVFRALELPRGVSDVRFAFQPESFRRGAWATLLALAFTIVLLGFSLFTVESETAPEPPVESR